MQLKHIIPIILLASAGLTACVSMQTRETIAAQDCEGLQAMARMHDFGPTPNNLFDKDDKDDEDRGPNTKARAIFQSEKNKDAAYLRQQYTKRCN